MANFVLRKLNAIKKRFVGLWQHTPSSSADDEILAVPDETISTEEGTAKLILNGRDVKPRVNTCNLDYSDELEVKGFLDQFPKHPLMLEPEQTVKTRKSKVKAKPKVKRRIKAEAAGSKTNGRYDL